MSATGDTRRRSPARVLFWLVLLMGAYWVPRGLQSNADSHLALSYALVEHHTARIDPYAAHLLDKAVYCGPHTDVRTCKHYFSDKAPGASLWAAAVYAVLRPVLPASMIPSGPNADRFLLRWLLTLLCITLPCAVFAATYWRFCRRFAPADDALWLTIAYAFGSMALPFSVLLFSHALSAALLFWAFILLYGQGGQDPAAPRYTPALAAGVLAGYAIGCEYPTVLIAFLLGLYALYQGHAEISTRPMPRPQSPSAAIQQHPKGTRSEDQAGCGSPRDSTFAAGSPLTPRIGRAVAYAGGVGLGLVPTVLYNLAAFGTPLVGGYTHLTDPYYAHGMARGILGVGLPQWDAVWGTTFSPYRGLFVLSPWLLMAAPGLWWMAHRGLRREAWLCGAISVVYFLFQSGYAFWDGGASVGPRQFLPALPFLAFPVLFTLGDWRVRQLGRVLIVLSVLQLFLVIITNPLYGDPRYVPNVRIPFVDQTLHDIATAHLQNNWGMVFALPSYASLLPLLFCLGWLWSRRQWA